jgi:hypothetical protein
MRLGHDCIKIAIADMPPIFAQMNGNAVASCSLNDPNRAHRVWMLTAAGVADGCDMIDIYAKAERGGHWR